MSQSPDTYLLGPGWSLLCSEVGCVGSNWEYVGLCWELLVLGEMFLSQSHDRKLFICFTPYFCN